MRNALSGGLLLALMGSVAVGALGCGQPPPTGPELVAKNTVRQAPPVAKVPVRQLIATAVNTSPVVPASAIPGAVVDARVLIITAGGTDSDLGAIQSTLQFLGTPFDVFNAGTTTLTADALASGSHGKYAAVFLETGNLSTSGGSAFTADEWTTLATYEAQFGVRRVSLYTSPTSSYGLADNGEVDPSKSPVSMTCTTAGAALFLGANCANPIVVSQGWVYPATVADSATKPLLVDASGNVYAATRTTSDGRETLALTFAQASYFNSYLELAYGLVNWATRGLFIGERHVYAVPQLDDLFLASDIYATGGTYRMTDTDMQALADWQTSLRANPQFAGFRIAWAVNGSGSNSRPGDPLTAKAIALGPTFAWINHTWDHPILDNQSYADALTEFTKNDAYLKGLPLTPYASISAVTPNISGLGSADAMQAIHDAGIRYLVSDTSHPDQDNPSPNVGLWNAFQPTVLEIPRIPTDLYFNVSQPAEWITEWEAQKKVTTVDYPTMIDDQSSRLAGYMLAGNKDPWMFHQANARNFDGAGHSLIADLLKAAFTKYAAASTFPVQSPTQDELAQIFMNRMTFQNAGATATIQPGTSITVSVTNAATVPVTGLCTPGAETYGGQTISYLNLAAGQSVTLSLAGCNPGTGGMGGAGGAAGTTGAAGASGTGGTGGMGGMTAGSAGASGTGVAGMSGTGVAGMSGTGVAGMSGTGVAGMSGTGVAGMSGTGVAGMSGTGVAGMSGTGVAGMPGTGMAGMSGMGMAGMSGGTAGAGGTIVGGTGGTGGAIVSGTGGTIVSGTGGMAGAPGSGGRSATGGAGGNPTTGAAGSGGGSAGGRGVAGAGGQATGGAAAGGHGGVAGRAGTAGAGGHGGVIAATGGHTGGGGAKAPGTGLTAGGADSGSGCDCAVTDGPARSGTLVLTVLGAALGLGARRRRKV